MEFPRFFESAAANVPLQDDPFADHPDNPRGLAPDWQQPAPAPWFVEALRPSDDGPVTTIAIPQGDPNPGGPPIDIDEHDWGRSNGFVESGPGAIACYVPWHADPRKWGIYFF